MLGFVANQVEMKSCRLAPPDESPNCANSTGMNICEYVRIAGGDGSGASTPMRTPSFRSSLVSLVMSVLSLIHTASDAVSSSSLHVTGRSLVHEVSLMIVDPLLGRQWLV
jgi:hypothetical protein